MNALVLSGGSIKGAFQAGAICSLLDRGATFDFISGTSVGALNGAYITAMASKYNSISEIDWKDISLKLKSLWFDKITGPDVLVKKRPLEKIAQDFLLHNGKFVSITDTEPLDDLISELISEEMLYKSPIEYNCCFVDINSSIAEYYSNRKLEQKPYIMHAIKASKAIPIIMQPIEVRGNICVDGGARCVEPLKPAIVDNMAKYIMAICCEPRNLNFVSNDMYHLKTFMARVMDIIVNQLTFDDVDYANFISEVINHCNQNKIQPPQSLKGKVALGKINVICPSKTLESDIENFTSGDIQRMFNEGYGNAEQFNPVSFQVV